MRAETLQITKSLRSNVWNLYGDIDRGNKRLVKSNITHRPVKIVDVCNKVSKRIKSGRWCAESRRVMILTIYRYIYNNFHIWETSLFDMNHT